MSASLETWEQLAQLIAGGDPGRVEAFLDGLSGEERARAVSRLDEPSQSALLKVLGPAASAELVAQFSDAQAVELLEDLAPPDAAAIVDELPSNEQADLLSAMTRDEAASILAQMSPDEAKDARHLLKFDADVAGGLMITEFLAFPVSATVEDVLRDLRENAAEYSDYEIQYAYITAERGRLVGVLRLRDLVLAQAASSIESIMIARPLHLTTQTPLIELKAFFAEHAYFGVPITTDEGALVGVVRRVAVEEAIGQRETEAFLSVSGLSGEDELRTMPLRLRAGRRLSWLSINILLNLLSASVIAVYQDTLSAVIALAVFLPIISDMSGCSGNQAVAVSIRELSLGLVRPGEFLRVVWKESAVGLLNGLVLGLLLGGAAALWKQNLFLGLVVGSALALNTLLAVVLGGVIPLMLKGLKQDPALASGPLLTTVTDMVGFLLVLSLASATLSRLV
ncbi:MAG: magnesium transporter [Myxococcus sp.]|nr:magnesium transporter [Myxococcus sp.]